jgi:methylglutaconyl-CoA hydratase
MVKYVTIKHSIENKVARITFCRPEIHNAFNSMMINELTHLFKALHNDKDIRVVVMTGEGKSYCAGADLNWMRAVKDYSYEQNLKESLELAALFRLIYEFPKPVIGRINGAAIGGGTGFVAVTDISICNQACRGGESTRIFPDR